MQGGAESRRKESLENGREAAPGSLRALRGVLGDARVYLKVSILVEAGEAVRHFAAFTPPQDDALRFAPSLPRHPPPPCFHASSHAHRARAAGCGGGREDVGGSWEGGNKNASRRESRRRRRLAGPEAEPSPHRSVSRPAQSDPSGPRMRARAGAPQALPEGKISGAGRVGGWGVSTCSLNGVQKSFLCSCLRPSPSCICNNIQYNTVQ